MVSGEEHCDGRVEGHSQKDAVLRALEAVNAESSGTSHTGISSRLSHYGADESKQEFKLLEQ